MLYTQWATIVLDVKEVSVGALLRLPQNQQIRMVPHIVTTELYVCETHKVAGMVNDN